jgi:hypothetical protein
LQYGTYIGIDDAGPAVVGRWRLSSALIDTVRGPALPQLGTAVAASGQKAVVAASAARLPVLELLSIRCGKYHTNPGSQRFPGLVPCLLGDMVLQAGLGMESRREGLPQGNDCTASNPWSAFSQGEFSQSRNPWWIARSGHAEVVVWIGEASALWPWLVRRRIGQYNSGNAALVAGSPNVAMEQWSDAMIVWKWSWQPHVGVTYWRGVEQRVLHRVNNNGMQAWMVILEEEDLHASSLEPFLQPGRLAGSGGDARVLLYKALYTVVCDSCRTHPNHPLLSGPSAIPRAERWLNELAHLPSEQLAIEAGCTDDNYIGGIAWSIAADGVEHVFSGTPLVATFQVTALNDIVATIANDLMQVAVP